MVAWSHYIQPSDVNRGDHIYALRWLGIYQHHGIVITAADATRLIPVPTKIETFMVIEQNRQGLRVANLEQFTYEEGKIIEGKRNLRRVQYHENPFSYGIKRRGSCYIEPALPSEMIVENAIMIYNTEKEKWDPYSLRKRNCEHFAYVCCTDLGRLSEQVLAAHGVLASATRTIVMTVGSLIWGHLKGFLTNVVLIGEKLVPSSLTNLTITSLDELVKSSLKGNAITAVVALGVEVTILTIRWIIWLCLRNNEEKRADYVAAGWAINTRKYVKCLVQAVAANGASFLMSTLGAIVGALIPLPGTTIGFSILFGFIGYVATRWGSRPIIEMLEKILLDTENE